jgi:hypothetical protein
MGITIFYKGNFNKEIDKCKFIEIVKDIAESAKWSNLIDDKSRIFLGLF